MPDPQDLFHRALELPAEEREPFLARECDGDEGLKFTLERLLDSDQAAQEQTIWRGSALQAEAKHQTASGPLRVGQVLGDYRIVEIIGEGGMGTVYRAVRSDTEYELAVAIKIVRGGFDSAALTERFRQERQILADLNHPHIARLLDGGTTPDGLPYLVMEFIAGQPITSYCQDHKLGIAERIRLFRQACSAVEFAHQRLVIHRDLKPANILVADDGQVKLLDFGVAKLLVEGDAARTIGTHWLTPAYASPEQVFGGAMTTVSDVYSLGVILYEVLCGHSPYRKKPNTLPEALQVTSLDPLPPSETLARNAADKALARKLRGDLDRIALKALRKEPARRYGSVEQLSEDLRRYLVGLPVRARGDGLGYRAGKFIRRNAIAVAAAAAVLAALAVGIVMTKRAETRANHQFNEVRRLAHTVLFDYHDAIADLPGSTPVRQKLVQDALSYLDGLSQQKQDEALEREIALAYVKVADVQGNTYNPNLGDTAGGLESARKAVAHAEPLYRKGPSPENAYVLGRAYLVMAIVIHSSDQIAGAEEYYKRAAAMFEQALKSQWNESWQTRRIEALSHLGDLYGLEGFANLGRTGDALTAYMQARGLAAALVQKYPSSRDAQEVLFLTQLSVALTEHRLGHAAEAEKTYREAIAINQDMLRDSGTPSDKQNLSSAYFALANQLLDRGRPEEALSAMEQSYDLVEEIATADPRNALFQRSLANKRLGLCRVYVAMNQPRQALPYCKSSVESLERLTAADTQSGDKRLALAETLQQYGDALLVSGNPRFALEQERRALALLADLPAGAQNEASHLSSLRAEIATGNAELAQGSTQAGISDLSAASEVSDKLVQQDPEQAYNHVDRLHAKLELARALIANGLCTEAAPFMQEAQAEAQFIQRSGILPSADSELMKSLQHMCLSSQRAEN